MAVSFGGWWWIRPAAGGSAGLCWRQTVANFVVGARQWISLAIAGSGLLCWQHTVVDFFGNRQGWNLLAADSSGYFQELAARRRRGTIESVAHVNDFSAYS